MIYSVITGTGCYIPTVQKKNEDFLQNTFFESNGSVIDKSNQEIISKFQEITTIAERKFIAEDLMNSDMAYLAAVEAIKSAGADVESLDYIIFAHNFGDVRPDNRRTDVVPSLAAKVKHLLGIKNPDCVCYDIIFGCPGWLQAVIQADYFIKSGDAKKILVIGSETLSRVSDPHDRDCMIFADGAGATILEAKESDTPIGILTHKSRTDTVTQSKMLVMGPSYNTDFDKKDDLFIKMNGRRLYQYALETVPLAMKACLDKCQIPLTDVKKILIHQANGKMDDAILSRLYALYDIHEVPESVMPMTIQWLGNSSVATIPTLLDLILKGNLNNHEINSGDKLVFASVGAGMSINALVYQV